MRKYMLPTIGLLWLLVFTGFAHAKQISWNVGVAGAPPFGDADTLTGAFDQIAYYAQTSTVQYDTDGSGAVSENDEFLDSGDLRVTGLLAPTLIDKEGLKVTYEVTARWADVQGHVTNVSLVDPVTGDTRIDVVYNSGTINVYLDTSLDSLFANPAGTNPPAGAGGAGFENGTLIATLNLKEGIGHTFIDPGGGDIQNGGSIDLLLEFTDALPGYWYDASGTEALDPVGSEMTLLFDMNFDRTTQVPGPAGALYTLYSNEDGSIFVEDEGCIDLEKEVSVDGGQTWFDADLLADAPVTGLAAAYRLIVWNCGDIPLTDVTLTDIDPTSTDPETILFTENIGDLQPGERKVIEAFFIADIALDGTYSNTTPIDGFGALNAPDRCNDPWLPGEGYSDGDYLNTAQVTTFEGPSDDDPAWVVCEEQVAGDCRMTGGSVTVNEFIGDDGKARVFYTYVEDTYADAIDGKINNGTLKKAADGTIGWVTTGGQINAPSTDIGPHPGHWTHTQHAGEEGIFTFLSGTSSAPPGTEISNVDCADPGWCVQARCAPFKQIFWDGIGYFPNKHGGVDFNANFPLPPSDCTVTPGGPSRDGTLHYYHAMVGDFGENDRKNRQPDNSECDWAFTGPKSYDVDDYTPIDAVLDDQFGDKGGQVCDKCADYYQIQIFCGATEETKGEVIYTFEDFIDGGNFQLHPETSEQCTVDLF